MNFEKIAEALNQNFPGAVKAEANDRGSLTIVVGEKSLDIDAEGNVYNIVSLVAPDVPPAS